MRLTPVLAAVAAVFALGVTADAQAPAKPAAPEPAAATPAAPASLNKQDVDAWLDGLIPYSLKSGDVAGAVVIVVKDGQVLTQRGYGYADVKAQKPVDPDKTLFRPGSVSKLFTWTAIMQLVEQGKLNLDTDVNQYIDFKIPPRDGKPITLRNLMTHTPGFEEWGKGLFVGDPAHILPLKTLIPRWTPKRIFAPGTVPAYSNYGASLAGYIVERVSGEPFDEYVANHILNPLGMTRSTFTQPLPKQFQADMAKDYLVASQPAKPYELVAGEPAGSLSATGADMGKFMLAYLGDGKLGSAQILKPETVSEMLTEQPKLNPPLNYMALGFYHEDRNGHEVVGHAGDTTYMHSELHILPKDHVGLFISMNSLGKEGAASRIREALFYGFMNRYYPSNAAPPPTTSTAKAHAAQMVGTYWWSRRSTSTFAAAPNLLSQTKVTAKPDGTIEVGLLKNKVWREVGPYVWKDADGQDTLQANVKDGKVIDIAESELPPVMVLMPVPAWANADWNLPLLYLMLAVLLGAVVLWPIQAGVRARYGHRFALQGRDAQMYRFARIAAIVQLAAFFAYIVLFLNLNNATSDGRLDGILRTGQVLWALGVVGALVLLWNAATVFRRPGRSWWAFGSSALLAIAGLAFVWFGFSLHLLGFSTMY
jgi:CubicO group peptidase (beta-lactamase class C family)